MSQDQKQPQQQQQAQQKDKPATDIYHVAGQGSLIRKGKQIKAGELLELTADEAKELGDVVAKGDVPRPPPDPSKRAAGRYKVKGPGVVLFKGEFRSVGFVMDLDEGDARSLGDAIEAA